MKNKKLLVFFLGLLYSIFVVVNFLHADEMSVAGNIFTSVYPKITIKVDPGLVHIGNIRNDPTVKSVSSPHEGQQVYKWFVFANTNTEKIERILSIYFTEVPRTWKMLQNDFGTEKDCITKNKIRLGKYDFDSCSSRVIVSGKGNVSLFLISKGYKLPKCIIQKRFGMYPSDTKGFTIEYAEDIESHGLSCSDFGDIRLLSDQAQTYIKDFEKRCMNSFSAQ